MRAAIGFVTVACACGQSDVRQQSGPTSGATASASGGGTDPTTGPGPDMGLRFDLNQGELEDVPLAEVCNPVDGLDGIGPCHQRAPADSFSATVQWEWSGIDDAWSQSIVLPLVAPLTDDNGDGNVDLCDTPDVILLAFSTYYIWDARIFALDGATGAMHFMAETPVSATSTPAIADLDGDGAVEIIARTLDSEIAAFSRTGDLLWVTASAYLQTNMGAIALADVDNDGDGEIAVANLLFDHQGNLLQTLTDTSPVGWGSATALADLDGDDDLEIVMGRSAFHHDGSPLFVQPTLAAGYPQIAQLDSDPWPEILLTNDNGLTVLEHTGAIKFANLRPTGVVANPFNWLRPSVVHDIVGDSRSEFAVSSQGLFAVYDEVGTVLWTAKISDMTGATTATAFDFLGAGSANAIYSDEQQLHVYDGQGNEIMTVPRSSGTGIEYPVVADIDNDGSAEIAVVSNAGLENVQTAPALQVVRDEFDRWIPARRIWNQHTYHVTNIREDGTLPQYEVPSWTHLNSYRVNAQIESGQVCQPEG